MTALLVLIDGIPRPKGSMRAVARGVMKEDNPNSKPWRERVLWAVRTEAQRVGWVRVEGPVEVRIRCLFDKPASAPKRRHTYPSKRSTGDVDKLARNFLDALVDAGAIKDDSQVVNLSIRKDYVGASPFPHSDRPGAVVNVVVVDEPEVAR